MELALWLHGHHLANVSEARKFRYRLQWTAGALEVHPLNSTPLSLNLPLSRKPVADKGPGGPVQALLEGVLPEGDVRARVAAAANVSSADVMGLLGHVGKECAGAIQFLPFGQEPGQGSVRALSGAEFTDLVTNITTSIAPDGETPHASLSGLQEKLLLTRMGEGEWGWPRDGAVSTHILKPAPEPTAGMLPLLVESEDWALKVARAAGCRAATSSIIDVAGRNVLVLERYDRDAHGARRHQEDFCQALGLLPGAKYESTDEGDRLTRLVARAAPRAEDPETFRRQLLQQVVFNVGIGNGDAHSKNYSILLSPAGKASLAPLYDVAPTMLLNRRFSGLGHVIAGHSRIEYVTADDLVALGAGFGLSRAAARNVVDRTLAGMRDAAHDVPAPDGLEDLPSRLETFWSRQGYLRSRASAPAPSPQRAKTTPASTSGSFAPHERGRADVDGLE